MGAQLNFVPALLARLNFARMVGFIATLGRRGQKSLTNRILFLQFIWTLVIYLLVIAAIWLASNLVIESSVRYQGEGWITKLDELGTPIYASNGSQAQLQQSLRIFPEIAQVKYLGANGREVIAEYTRKGETISEFSVLSEATIQKLGNASAVSNPGSEQRAMQFEKGDNSQMRIFAPIVIKSISSDGLVGYSLNAKRGRKTGKESGEKAETIGFVEVVLDYSKLSSELNRNMFYASMLIAVMMLAVAWAMRVMVRWALMPLSDLEEPLTRLANGETDITVTTSGDKEIARIGKALNATISALRERDDALRRMVDHDRLTGLVNRSYFAERLDQEVNRVAHHGGSSALYFFDLDRFKNINDNYGHAAGDRLLIQVAKQLTPRIREHDVFARYGGDEFTLLAYNVDQKNVREIAESFITLMREFTFFEAGDAIKIHFSIGVTLINNATLSSHDYLKEADTAIHQAKMQGRNCYSIFERSSHSVVAETGVGWHEHLQTALQKRLAILFYQHMAGLKGQQKNLCEVLLRLPSMDQKGGGEQLINPGVFMSAAERFGMMPDFDCMVIEKSAQVLEELNDPDMVLSVNLSEQFFSKENILGFLDEVINKHGIKPSQLIFELSQRYIPRHIDKLQELLASLTERGYLFAIDDFGADFGAFNYIRKFPVHFLKIDGDLVAHLTSDKIAQATIRAIVEVATELHMQTIAKNVSNAQEEKALREIGVDYMQGNHIAPPSAQLK